MVLQGGRTAPLLRSTDDCRPLVKDRGCKGATALSACKASSKMRRMALPADDRPCQVAAPRVAVTPPHASAHQKTFWLPRHVAGSSMGSNPIMPWIG
jgi:hypothetical protein